MITKYIALATVAAAGGLAAGTAQAAYVTTFGQSANSFAEFPLVNYVTAANARNTFVAGAPLKFESFESYAAGLTTLDVQFGAVKATMSGTGGSIREVPAGETEEGRYSVSGNSGSLSQGTKFWQATATNSGATFEILFDNAVSRFGFFGIDIGDFNGVLQLELLNAGNQVIGTVSPGDQALRGPLADGSVMFFGVSASNESEWFRGVRIRSIGTNPADVFAFDSFTVVGGVTQPAPASAPGTLALLGLALTGLALMRRRA